MVIFLLVCLILVKFASIIESSTVAGFLIIVGLTIGLLSLTRH